MNLADFIPTGRTALVNKGTTALQIQTEYAYRPYPRITTSISHNGQVLHKIEKKLPKPIESIEERSAMEERMKRQHSEIIKIIKSGDSKSFAPSPDNTVTTETTVAKSPTVPETPPPPDNDKPVTIHDQIKEIKGVRYLYQLDLNGNFVNKIASDHFKNSYSALFKTLPDMLEVFAAVSSDSYMTREKGVYEIERDAMYFLSSGEDLYFVMLDKPDSSIDYEQLFKSIVAPSALDQILKSTRPE